MKTKRNWFSCSFGKQVKHSGLMRKCVEAALDSLTVDNVIGMLEKSLQHEERRVQEACWR